ncbi:hypothetical protein D3C72_2311560 [compost metagenome]
MDGVAGRRLVLALPYPLDRVWHRLPECRDARPARCKQGRGRPIHSCTGGSGSVFCRGISAGGEATVRLDALDPTEHAMG